MSLANVNKMSSLMVAAQEGNAEYLEELVDGGVEIKQQNGDGECGVPGSRRNRSMVNGVRYQGKLQSTPRCWL